MNGRASALLLAVVVALGTGACSAGSSSRASGSDARAAVAQPQAAPGTGAAAGAAAGPAAGPAKAAAPTSQPLPTPAPAGRSIAYSGQLSMLARDVDRVVQQATDLATASGGYVELENSDALKDGSPSAHLVLKVPAAEYQKSLDQLASLGSRVLSRTSQAQDMTQQVVDVNSRLKSQQASVDRVRTLMAQAQSIGEVVSLESELSRREADLESLQSQQQALAAQTALSTITVNVQTEQPATGYAPARKEGFGGSIGDALGAGWHVLVTIVRWLLIALAATTPFLLVLGPLGWIAVQVRRRRPKPAAVAPQEEREEEQD